MNEQDPKRQEMHRRKDALFTSEEAVVADRESVAKFDKVSSEPRGKDVEDQVMPNVPTSAVDPTVDNYDQQGRAG